jgi:transcription elongation GreA/GreB family factor
VAETQYDTLAIEQSYLAEGQSRRVEEIRAAISQLQKMIIRYFSDEHEITLGSIVRLETKNEQSKYYFITPCAGGLRCQVALNNHLIIITAITPASPLGQTLMGKYKDDIILFSVAKNHTSSLVSAIY